jgi:hypothetical protein
MRTDTNKGREILAAIGALGMAGLTAFLLVSLVAAQSTVPLPTNVRIVKPGPEVPVEQAAFSGKWFGIWNESGEKRYGKRDHILIVERIDVNPSRVRVVYAWGPRPELAAVPDRAQSTGAGNSRMTGQFVEGELHLRRSDGAFIRYRMSTDDTVEATWEMGRFKEKAVMRRVKD